MRCHKLDFGNRKWKCPDMLSLSSFPLILVPPRQKKGLNAFAKICGPKLIKMDISSVNLEGQSTPSEWTDKTAVTGVVGLLHKVDWQLYPVPPFPSLLISYLSTCAIFPSRRRACGSPEVSYPNNLTSLWNQIELLPHFISDFSYGKVIY